MPPRVHERAVPRRAAARGRRRSRNADERQVVLRLQDAGARGVADHLADVVDLPVAIGRSPAGCRALDARDLVRASGSGTMSSEIPNDSTRSLQPLESAPPTTRSSSFARRQPAADVVDAEAGQARRIASESPCCVPAFISALRAGRAVGRHRNAPTAAATLAALPPRWRDTRHGVSDPRTGGPLRVTTTSSTRSPTLTPSGRRSGGHAAVDDELGAGGVVRCRRRRGTAPAWPRRRPRRPFAWGMRGSVSSRHCGPSSVDHLGVDDARVHRVHPDAVGPSSCAADLVMPRTAHLEAL